MISDRETPREGDVHPGADHHTAADLGTEEAQGRHLQHRGNGKPRRKEQRTHHPPEKLRELRGTATEVGVIVVVESHGKEGAVFDELTSDSETLQLIIVGQQPRREG